MRNFALASGLVLGLSTACAPAPPDFDLVTSVPHDSDIRDGSDERDGGIRILSDVTPPGQADVSKGRGGAGGSDARDATSGDALADALEDGSIRDDTPVLNEAAVDRGVGNDAKGTDTAVAPPDAASDAPRDTRDTRTDATQPDGAVDTVHATDAFSARDTTDGEAEGGVVLGTCTAVRQCLRSGVQTEEGCLRGASDAARSTSEPLLTCEAAACATPCRTAYVLAACNACLLTACPAALVACAQQSGCGDGVVAIETEECDDGNADDHDGCTAACSRARCGDGFVFDGQEACDDGNENPFDGCGYCLFPAGHLLITEVVTRPAGAEFVEILNPTALPIALSDYLLSDSHLYYEVASGTFATASGSDFAARFPDAAVLEPGRYAVVALGNASGGSQSFAAAYGKVPDFELRPTANQAADDATVPNMVAVASSSIGASASLTDGGEPLVLFSYRGGDLVSDVDYVFYGTPSTSNPMVDKTGVVAGASAYLADTPASAQHATAAPGEAGSIHRCVYAESHETAVRGNGMTGHDETSEDVTTAFAIGSTTAARTPGGPPAAGVCP